MTTSQTHTHTATDPPTDPPTARPPARPALWDRRFTLFFTARTISLVGDAMMPVAAALAVGALYGISGVGYVLGTWTGTFVVLVLLAGCSPIASARAG